MTICVKDLMKKEVINIINGKKLGYIDDMTLDHEGMILTIKVVKKTGFFDRGQSEAVVLPWEAIIKMSCDVILVKATECAGIEGECKSEKKTFSPGSVWLLLQSWGLIIALVIAVLLLLKSCFN